jgi:uncharacterized protein (UPF0371 family)
MLIFWSPQQNIVARYIQLVHSFENENFSSSVKEKMEFLISKIRYLKKLN